MKKLYAILGSALLALPVMAQQPQLPNAGFEEGWGPCTPWTSNNNTKTHGETCTDWTISHVIGANGTGKTAVGGKVEGYNSTSAIQVTNSANSVVSSVAVPGYATLGTTWSTSVMNKDNDGGSFGGYAFNGRPLKISFMYKFEGDNSQPANAIAYLWKGTTSQAKVPASILALPIGSPKTCTMVDRDRNILGITTAKGGAVTKSADFELIAKGTTVITETTSEWVKGEIVFEYYSEATPEKINVIFAANDYFNPTGQIIGNKLTVDDVMCVYPESTPEPDPAPVPDGKPYAGKLVVEMEGSGEITEPGGTDGTVYINQLSQTTCSFLLPNLSLGELGTVGDIFLPEVNMAIDEKDFTTFSADVKGFQLLDGAIIADIVLNGTVDKEGNASFVIIVGWIMDETTTVPINVTFNGKGDGGFSGVHDITVDDANAPAVYYNLQGVRVNNPRNGLYIRVQGKNVSKVAIR